MIVHKHSSSNSENYKNHPICIDLNRFIDFYSSFSFAIMSYPTLGTKTLLNVDTYFYASIQGTLDSIKIILKQGKIGDSFALLRKYYDSTILNIYINLYLTENCNMKNNFSNVQEINAWLENRKFLPHNNFNKMAQYIEKSNSLKDFFAVINKDISYSETRNRCNDHLHYNYFDNLLVNDDQVYFNKRIMLLNSFQTDLENIFILHFSCIFILMIIIWQQLTM